MVLSGIKYVFPSDKPDKEYWRGLEVPGEDNGSVVQEVSGSI